jgi:hypothetical protein
MPPLPIVLFHIDCLSMPISTAKYIHNILPDQTGGLPKRCQRP